MTIVVCLAAATGVLADSADIDTNVGYFAKPKYIGSVYCYACHLDLSREFAELDDWTAPALHAIINGFAAGKGLSLGKLAQPIRLAVCGGTISPPIDATTT